MKNRFSKENMWTVTGFLLDSFDTDQAAFTDVAATEFNAAFRSQVVAARLKIKTATGAALRAGAGTQVTDRLYNNLDLLKPLLDKLDIRLGLADPKLLTVPVKAFGLKNLRRRAIVRDAEAVSRALTVLDKAIVDNQAHLTAKGYKAQELTDLRALHQAIDADNVRQNKARNDSGQVTEVENADYAALDALLGKLMRTGRLLFKNDKKKRQQYEATALLKRVKAGELPAVDAAG